MVVIEISSGLKRTWTAASVTDNSIEGSKPVPPPHEGHFTFLAVQQKKPQDVPVPLSGGRAHFGLPHWR